MTYVTLNLINGGTVVIPDIATPAVLTLTATTCRVCWEGQTFDVLGAAATVAANFGVDEWLGISQATEPPEDFLANSGVAGTLWSSAGTGTISGLGTIAGHPGIANLGTGAGAAFYRNVYRGAATQFRTGTDRYDFQSIVSIPTLATAPDDFSVFVGPTDMLAVEPTNGLYFMAPSVAAGLGANWLACSASAGVRTRTDTGIALTAGAWRRMLIVFAADGLSAKYYVAGTLVATVTTNLPAATALWGCYALILKNNGANARNLYVDLIGQRFQLTNPR